MAYYFDYMAATPIDPAVKKTMLECMNNPVLFANTSATHSAGREAKHYLHQATQTMLNQINAADNDKLIFTSGATEATNLALIGSAQQYIRNGKHIIATTIEHHATLSTLTALKKQGYAVSLVAPNAQGIITIDSIRQVIQPDTILLSIGHINNEIGVIQDIHNIGQLCQQHGIMLHIDAAQSIGKLSFDLQSTNADFVSFSAHKCYGPKGIGCLYVRHNRKLQPILHGGNQQHTLRPGTVPLMLILAMVKAWEIAEDKYKQDTKRITKFHDLICRTLHPDTSLHGHPTQRVAHNIMISLPDRIPVDDVSKLRDIFNISSSAACTQHIQSHVLNALGVSPNQQMRAMRISLGRWSKESHCKELIKAINQLCNN
tara:strand:- start:234 stop:1352 length:1119 start_codon:yes stop_codon:yes gene_type:complete